MDQLLAVVLVLALLGGALWLLRRRGAVRFPARRGSLIEVLDSRPLAPGQMLHVVRIAGRTMVLASHQTGCTLLDARAETESSCSASR